MYNGSPVFIRFRRYGQRISSIANNQGSWLILAPGMALIFLGLAILIWPELLAYMVAGLFLAIGITLAAWGWRMRRLQQRMQGYSHNVQNITPRSRAAPGAPFSDRLGC